MPKDLRALPKVFRLWGMVRSSLSAEAIVSTAAQLADQQGLNSVSLSAVARKLGVQTASLYSHIRNVDALLAGIHQLGLSRLADRIASHVAGRAGYDALVGLTQAYREFAAEEPGKWAAMQQPAAPETVASSEAKRVAELTIAVLRGYQLPEVELVHATRFLASTINGFLALAQNGNFDHRAPEIAETWDRIVLGLDELFKNWSSTHNKNEEK